MINKSNIEIPYPGIMIFRNGLENLDEIIAAIDADENWEQWYDVGEQIIFNPRTTLMFDKEFPNEEQWKKARIKQLEKTYPKSLTNIIDSLEEVFYEATSHYFKEYPAKLDNWMHAGSNILKYHGRPATEDELKGKTKISGEKHDTTKGQAGGTEKHTLPFHTDFYQADALKPGPKAEYTITIYLNDDYVGGEIDYRIFEGNFEDMRMENGDISAMDPSYGEIPKIMYRPQAGDIIIFPSRPPYYHGVRRVEAGIKKFVRMFWMSWLYEDKQNNEVN